MITYIDTYISGPDKTELETFARNFVNYIPVECGVPAQPEDNTASPPTPAIEQHGDPSLFYTCIRATFDISPLVSGNMRVVDSEIGESVVGVFL